MWNGRGTDGFEVREASRLELPTDWWGCGLLVVAGTTSATAEEQSPTAVDAISAVAPEVFQDVAATEGAGGAVAAEAEIVEAGLVISVPTDPAAGISVGGGGVDLGMGLPNGTEASPASVDGDGSVSTTTVTAPRLSPS